MTTFHVADHFIAVPTLPCLARLREVFRVTIVAAFLTVGSLPAVARSGDVVAVVDEGSAHESATMTSGDRLLAHIVAQYGRAELDRGGWTNPYVPSAAAGNPIASVPVGEGVTLVAAEPRDGASGDDILMQAVAQYTRAALDRGGWENPFVTDGRCAAGNALLAVRPGEGVTTRGIEAEPTTISQRQRNPR